MKYTSRPTRKGSAQKAWDGLQAKMGGKSLEWISWDRGRQVWMGAYYKRVGCIHYWPRFPKTRLPKLKEVDDDEMNGAAQGFDGYMFGDD